MARTARLERTAGRTIAGQLLDLRPELAPDCLPEWLPDWSRVRPAGPQSALVSGPVSGLVSGPARQKLKEQAPFLPLAPVQEIRQLQFPRPVPGPAQMVPSPKVPHLQRVPERLVEHALPCPQRQVLAAAHLPVAKAERHPVLQPEQRQQPARPQASREPQPNRLLQRWIPESRKRECRTQRPQGSYPPSEEQRWTDRHWPAPAGPEPFRSEARLARTPHRLQPEPARRRI